MRQKASGENRVNFRKRASPPCQNKENPMKTKRNLLSTVIVGVAVIVLAVCFFVSMNIMEDYAEENCFDSIEEATAQITNMFLRAMDLHKSHLTMFADILAANDSNPDGILLKYMENFCKTQNFSAVCVHRKDGSHISYGKHPHGEILLPDFESEAKRLPYISDVYKLGETRKDSFVYIAVPAVRNGEVGAVLYGYVSLDAFPKFISSTAYDGKGKFYIVDGNNGDFLINENSRFDPETGEELPLGNIFTDGISSCETKPGYNMESMERNVKSGESGYYIYLSQKTGQWFYTYYMPIGINNWSMQMTVDEPTAFAAYNEVRGSVFVLMICIIAVALLVIVVLLIESAKTRKEDKRNLRKSNYINDVQGVLIGAYNNPEFVLQALKIIAKDFGAETVLLLNFNNRIIEDAYYWPSVDRPAAQKLLGLDVSEAFPTMFDTLISDESMYIDEDAIANRLSAATQEIFRELDVKNMLIVPIMDNAGALKAAITTVNIPPKSNRPEMLQCLTRDFFLAITNLESYNVIKNMGTIDYLTGVKNRNSYEAELLSMDSLEAQTLWCVYIDANGLHEINNTFGHKAGDLMLHTVADAIKRVFGKENTYRIGGDEFLAFAADMSEERVYSRKQELIHILEAKGYSVSVGMKCAVKNADGKFEVESLVDEAEAIMYEEKRAYYKQNNLPERR